MPAVAISDQQPIRGELGVGGQQGLDCGERGRFGVAALAIQAIEFGGQLSRAGQVARREQLDHVRSNIHAAGGVDARSKSEGNIEAGERSGCRVEGRGGKQRAQAGAYRFTQLAKAEGGDGAVFAMKRNRIGDGGYGGHLQKTGQSFFAGANGIAPLKNRLRELESNGCAAQRLFRVCAAGLVGVQDRQRVRDYIVGLRQVMIGDDQVKTQLAGGFRFGEGSHAGVDRDHQADTVGIRCLEHARLQSVALTKAVGNMKANKIVGAAEHFNGSFQQDDGGGAVHVVIAVEQNGFMRGDGPFQPLDGRCHSRHQEGIVEVGELGVEESRGFAGRVDAAGDQQLGKHRGNSRGLGQGLSFLGMRLGDGPDLTGIQAGTRNRRAGWSG